MGEPNEETRKTRIELPLRRVSVSCNFGFHLHNGRNGTSCTFCEWIGAIKTQQAGYSAAIIRVRLPVGRTSGETIPQRPFGPSKQEVRGSNATGVPSISRTVAAPVLRRKRPHLGRSRELVLSSARGRRICGRTLTAMEMVVEDCTPI